MVIQRCDEKQGFILNENDKLYAPFEIEDWSERLKKSRPARLTQTISSRTLTDAELHGHGFGPRTSGAEVTVTIDSVDTGERRQLGHYTARHVKVKTQFEPSPGASTPATIEETDGWYIDLPGLGCQEQASRGFSIGRLVSGNRQNRLQIKWLGTAPRGYPIEETSLRTEAGSGTISKVELLEISEAPLNPSLFEPPVGYGRALQTGNGGADLTKADTLSNRAQYYWARFTYWVRDFFR